MRIHDRTLVGIGPGRAQGLLIGLSAFLVSALGLLGCASPEPQPLPPSAFLGGIEPPPDFDPYLTREQQAERTVAARQVPVGPEYDQLGGPGLPGGSGEISPPPSEQAAPTRVAIAQAEASTKWSIVIAAFRGEQAEAQAQQALAMVEQAGINGAYLERRGQAIALAYGRYNEANDPLGKQALASLQAIEIDGERPFARAVLAPPSPELLKGSIPEYSLRTVKQRFGPDAIYTLQIGLYGRSDRTPPEPAELAEYRQAAERAVYDLRREGEQAFYYHAPTRSTITIGVFGPDDHDPMAPGLESEELSSARLRHPNNLLNGQGIRERVQGKPENDPGAWRIQPSSLVGVPRS